MRYIKGSVLEPVTLRDPDEQQIIAHVCNDVGAFGAGVALAIANAWPATKQGYLASKPYVRGSCQFVRVSDYLTIANMIAQRGLRSRTNPIPLDYDALALCLQSLREIALTTQATVHLPMIGTGLAGGKWERIEPMIETALMDVEYAIYAL